MSYKERCRKMQNLLLEERGSADSICNPHLMWIVRGNLCLSANKGHADILF